MKTYDVIVSNLGYQRTIHGALTECNLARMPVISRPAAV